MSKIKQTKSRMIDSNSAPFEPGARYILSDFDVIDAMRRGRRLQAQAIARFFSRLGK